MNKLHERVKSDDGGDARLRMSRLPGKYPAPILFSPIGAIARRDYLIAGQVEETNHRQHFFSVFFMHEEGCCLSRCARVCANLHRVFSDPKRDFQTMPYNARVRANWRMCDQEARHITEMIMTKTPVDSGVGAGNAGNGFEPFIDKKETGKRAQIRPRTIDDWMKRGLLPYYKVGRSVRFKWSEVEAHLAENCRVCRRSKVK